MIPFFSFNKFGFLKIENLIIYDFIILAMFNEINFENFT